MMVMEMQLLKTVKLCDSYWLNRGCRLMLDRDHALALIRAKLAMPVRRVVQGECRDG